jgi:hypothetical protein
LGQQNLLVISIIDIEKLVQIAGDVQMFGKPREIEGKLPEMTRNIIDGTKIDWTNKPRLSVVNPRLGDNTDPAAANVLGEILGIEITRTGKYAVYPRNMTLEAVQTEWDNQRRGAAATADPQGPGNGDRPDHVLSVIARGGEGSVTAARFNASIINMDTREQVSFTSQTYQDIEGGTVVMQAIARELTITDAKRSEDEKKRLEDEKAAADQWAQGQRERDRRDRQAKRAAWWRERKEYAFRSYIDWGGFSFPWGDEVSGGYLWDVLGFYWSFLPFTSIGLQGELGFLKNSLYPAGEDLIGVGGVIFNAGLVFPLTTNDEGMNVSLYGDGLLEINLAAVKKGLLAERVTPGFDCGISFLWGYINRDRWGFDIKYRGLWYKDLYLNAISIGLTMGLDLISWND